MFELGCEDVGIVFMDAAASPCGDVEDIDL